VVRRDPATVRRFAQALGGVLVSGHWVFPDRERALAAARARFAEAPRNDNGAPGPRAA